MSERSLFLDRGIGETRGVVLLDGRPERLLIELSASDAADFNGIDHLEIRHATPAGDLAEVEATLRIILDGTGTYISELDN